MAFRKALHGSLSSLRNVIHRNCSSSAKVQTPNLKIVENPNKHSLTEPLPWLPKPIYRPSGNKETETQVTTLPNGLRVATENSFGRFFTAGVLIDSGSRYEVAFPSGISHFLEKLAFNSTENYENKDAILKELEDHGGICDCQSSRDTTIYAVSAETSGLESVVKMLSDVVLRPIITDEELLLAKQTISFELEDLELRPEKEMVLTEMIHSASYNGNTLGLPKICPANNILVIDKATLFTYLKNYYIPSRMVLAAVGVEHERLVEYAMKHLVENKAIWEKNTELVMPQILTLDNSISQYTGGITTELKDLSDVSLGPTPMPELAHAVVALESSSHQHDDFISFCVLNMMMGGGGSFSAGGPGKGMYTRLYTNVLNRYHWMYNATAYNHAYNDSGIFCIHASAHPSQMKDLVSIIVKEFVSMIGRVSHTELDRAKKQLQSMLLMNLESRPVLFEDMGRQVLSSGHRKQPSYYIDKIQKISEDDVRRVASNMLKTKPSIAALGNLDNLPDYNDIVSGLLNKEGKMPKRFSLFR